MNGTMMAGTGLVLCTTLAACSSNKPPNTELTAAQSAVSAAEARGAQEVPQASLHLKMAKDAIGEAEEFMKNKDYEKAKAALERAHIDAQLAKSLATEEQIKEEAQEQIERVKSLEQTNARMAPQPYG